MKKYIGIGLFTLFLSFNAIAAPVPPQNGGTGISNNAANTITFNGAYPLTANMDAATTLNLSATNQIWVSSDTNICSDSTGNGTIYSPYCTYEMGAVPVCESSATTSTPYVVNIVGGETLVGNMYIEPYCNVNILSGAVITPQVVLGTAWDSVNNATTTVTGAISATGGIDLAFGAGDQNLVIFNIDPLTTPSFSVTSPNTNSNGNAVWLNALPNAQPGIFSSGAIATDTALVVQNVDFAGNVQVEGTGAPNAGAAFQNVQIDNVLTEIGNPSSMYIQANNSVVTALSLIGASGVYNTDSDSYPNSISYSAGATIAQIGTLSNSSGMYLSSEFTPANFSLVSGNWPASSITAAFAGIDAELSNLMPPHGSYTPVVTCINNCSSPVAVKGFYTATGTGSGTIQTVTAEITFTATSGTGNISISCPTNPGFTALGQAAGIATINRTTGANIGDGIVAIIDSSSGANGPYFNWIVSNSSVNYTIHASFQCQIQ